MTAAEELQAVSPRPIVLFDEEDHGLVRDNLVALQLEDRRGGLSSLEVRLKNFRSLESGGAGRAFDGDDVVRLGAGVRLGMGDETDPYSMFGGTVTAIEELYDNDGPPQLLVLAEDALQKARMARRTVVHADLRIPSFVEDLASRVGLTPRVEGFDDPLGRHVQLNESDLAFLRRVLVELDGEIQVIEGELHVRPVPEVRRGEIELAFGVNLERCRLAADLAHQVTQATVSGWDATNGRRISATSQTVDLGPGQGVSGAASLDRALGGRSEHLAHVPVQTAEEAQTLADAAFAQRARNFVRLEATANGDPRIRVGAHVRLTGVSPRFANTYVVVAATQRFDRRDGYKTDFEAECAFLKESR